MTMTKMIKTYSELITYDSFLDRFRYLKLNGKVSEITFGAERYLNQAFYQSFEWRRLRKEIILRDFGRDLGVEGFEIGGNILIHHINSITINDIREGNPMVFDPENLICTTKRTHNAIHYGDETLLNLGPIVRTPNDTCPWKN